MGSVCSSSAAVTNQSAAMFSGPPASVQTRGIVLRDSATKANATTPQRPTSALSRHSLQSPAPSIVSEMNEEEITPEALVQSNPEYSNTLTLLDSVVENTQAYLEDPSNDNIKTLCHVLGDFESAVVEHSPSGQSFMAEYLAVKDYVQQSKKVYDLIVARNGFQSLMEAELKGDLQEERIDLLCLAMIRSSWWNTSDASRRIAKKMAPTGIYEDVIAELRDCDAEDRLKASFGISFQSAVGVLHNCAKEVSVRPLFRDCQLVEVLAPFLKVKNAKGTLIVLMALGLIIDESQNDLLLADDKIFDMLLMYTSRAWKSPDRRYEGFQVEELVVGICNIAKNDSNKKVLVQKDVMSILEPILQSGSDAEKQVAMETVLELAFHKDNQAIIKERTVCMKVLEEMNRSTHKGISKAAQGAMWLLCPEKSTYLKKKKKKITGDSRGMPPAPTPPSVPGMPHPPPPPPIPGVPPEVTESKTQQGHIMISYSWSEQKILLQVRTSLREAGFPVWMDVDDMGGSTLQAMAEAVEEADVVLVCLSQRYKDSQNCRIEAEYAFQKNKRIVPLRVERGYVADGWLGILCGAKLFFDFSGKYPYEKKIQELVRELKHFNKDGVTDSVDAPIKSEKAPVVLKPPPPVAAGISVATWKSADILKWLKDIGLAGNKQLESLCGEDLEFLKDLSTRAPEYYFGFLERKLGLDNLRSLRLFSTAIDKLP